MKPLITILLVSAAFTASSQSIFKGVLMDSVNKKPVQFAHVANYSGESMDITDVNGKFSLPAKVGDTVVFSSVGYQRIGWQVKEEWVGNEITLYLPQDTILLKEITVNNLPPEVIFKQRILDQQPVDSSFWYHGMEKPIEKEDPTLNEKVIKNPLFVATHPLSALYYNFSKEEKERRKYHKIAQSELKRDRVNRKFNREWVKEVTELDGDELTSFIAFCDYSIEYLDKTPLYIIREDLLAKLDTFRKEQKG